MQFANNPDNGTAWHHDSGYFPTTRGAVARLRSEGWFATHPAAGIGIGQVHPARPTAAPPVLGAFDPIQNALRNAMHDVLTAGADPRTRFTQATADAQRALDWYNAHCVTGGLLDAACLKVDPTG